MSFVYIFDLDGTLYPESSGYEAACKERVFSYMVDKLVCASTISDAKRIWSKGYEKYHQTLKVLRALGLKFDEEEYWKYMRGNCRAYLAASQDTREFLRSLSGQKYVFTNCHEAQAIEALEALNLADCFDGVFGAHRMGTSCKPEVEAFSKMIRAFNIKDTSRCVFFEDSVINLRIASKVFNMITILITNQSLPIAELQRVSSDEHLDGVVVGQSNLLKCLSSTLSPDVTKWQPRANAAFQDTSR